MNSAEDAQFHLLEPLQQLTCRHVHLPSTTDNSETPRISVYGLGLLKAQALQDKVDTVLSKGTIANSFDIDGFSKVRQSKG